VLKRLVFLLPMLLIAAVSSVAAGSAARTQSHAIAMHGEPALEDGFAHFPYVRPDAPKGGRIVFGMLGTFDTLNPYSVIGIAAEGVAPINGGLVWQSLMARSADEPFSLYGQIARSIETPDDRSSVTFRLDPAARFSDGKPVTADDVLFSWDLLKRKGKPNLRSWYGMAKTAEAPDPYTVRFDLTGANNRELPLILALMPVLPKHAVDEARFEETNLTPPIGSGPYVVEAVRPGESISYRRNPDYWGKDLPTSRGRYNADEIRYDYYLDANTLFEAFKGGLVDVRIEDSPTRWTTGYDFPAFRDGTVVKDPIPVRTPKGMNAFVFNTRRPVFADARVREALGYLFDFDWVNRTLFNGVYARTASFFEGSDLASTGRPASEGERAILAAFPGAVRPEILEGNWHPAGGDGSGRDRDLARRALDLLAQAGWTLQDGVLRNAAGEPFQFEFLASTRLQERLAINFARALARIGVRMDVRYVYNVEYWRRLSNFDFDMIQFTWGSSPSPGNEQYNRWSSKAADRAGSLNYAGARSPAVDAAVDAMVSARRREDFVDAVRALDRVLLSQFYVIPLYNQPEQWIAHTAAVKRPESTALFGFQADALWRESR
jgi:peptide/nickel transport system substrate-binding protein